MFESSSAAAAARSSPINGTVWYERPSDGRRVRIRKLVWRLWGFLLGPFGMFVGGLWLNGLICLGLCVGIAIATVAYLPDWSSNFIFPVGAVWGLFIPELLERKYLRAGWRKVGADEPRVAQKPLMLEDTHSAEPDASVVHKAPEPSAPSGKPWQQTVGELAIGLAVLAVSLWAYGWLKSQQAASPPSTVAAAAAPTESSQSPGMLSDCAEVTRFAAEQTSDPVFPRRIRGTLRNKCDYPARVISIDFALYDASGAVVGDTGDAVQNLGAGERWNFDLPITESSATNIKLSKLEAYN